MMTLDDFKALIAAYGSQPERWPDAARPAALKFMAEHKTLVSPALDAEAELDRAIARGHITPGTDLLQARILQDLAAKSGAANDPAPAAPKTAPRTAPNRAPAWGLRAAALIVGVCAAGLITAVLSAALWRSMDSVRTPSSQIQAGAQQNPSLTSEALLWADAALDYGVADIYEWVEAEDASDSVPLYE